MAHHHGPDHSRHASLAYCGPVLFYSAWSTLDRLRVARRRAHRGCGANRWSARVGHLADCFRQRGDACAVRVRDNSREELESGIPGRRDSVYAGICAVHHASADVGLSVSRADADCAGAFPPRKAVADLVCPTLASRLGEHARLVHHRAGDNLCLPSVRSKGIPRGSNRS